MFSAANILPFAADRNKDLVADLFRNAPPYITERSVVKNLLPDEPLIHAGQRADYVYIHISGKLAGVDNFDAGITYNFIELHPVDIIGEFEAFSGTVNYLISIHAIARSTLVAIGMEDFLKWMQTDIGALNIICRMLAVKLTKELKANREYLFLDSYDRLVLYIYQLCKKLNPLPPIVSIRKKRREIAAEIGFCEKTINRTVNELVNEGIITYGRNMINITYEQFLLMQKYVEEHDLCS